MHWASRVRLILRIAAMIRLRSGSAGTGKAVSVCASAITSSIAGIISGSSSPRWNVAFWAGGACEAAWACSSASWRVRRAGAYVRCGHGLGEHSLDVVTPVDLPAPISPMPRLRHVLDRDLSAGELLNIRARDQRARD